MSTKAEEVKYIACSKCGAPVWVIKEADSARAEKSMQEKGVKRFPVEDKGVIVGRARRKNKFACSNLFERNKLMGPIFFAQFAYARVRVF
jgi:hypothetical protein